MLGMSGRTLGVGCTLGTRQALLSLAEDFDGTEAPQEKAFVKDKWHGWPRPKI